MSATVLEPRSVPVRADDRPSLLRMTRVELRKMTDTRSGFWVLLSVAVLMVTIALIAAFVGTASDHTLRNLVSAAIFPAGVLLPVVGILLVSSEWSQRTGMITFGLVPQRWRVLAAKSAAVLPPSLIALALALGIGVIATAAGGATVDGTWSLPPAVVGQEAVLVASSMLMGIGFGAALLSSAPAIVVYFGLPLVFQALGAIPGVDGPAGWIDGARSLSPMSDHVMNATEWARAGTTLALWILVPLAIGAWRIARSEVR